MPQRWGRSVIGVTLGMVLSAATAEAGEIRSDDNAGQRLLQQKVTRLLVDLSTATKAAESAGVTTSSNWIDTRKGSMLNSDAANPGDAWSRVALIISDLATLFGARGDNILAQTGPQGFYFGTEGGGGIWSVTAGGSQSALMRQMLADNTLVPQAVRDAMAGQPPSADIDALAQAGAAALEKNGPILATGTTTTITLTSARLDATSLPHIYGPAGMRVARIERAAADKLTVTMDVRAATPAGQVELRAFNPNSSFLAADTFKAFVVAGSGDVAKLADDHQTTRSAAKPLIGSIEAEIGSPGDEDLFRAELSARGTLTLTTSGPTDVALTLEDAAGNPIATDDDGAGWYNSRIVRALSSGIYFVRVRHAARGTGRYTLRSDFAAN